jgi:hypothetical protein
VAPAFVAVSANGGQVVTLTRDYASGIDAHPDAVKPGLLPQAAAGKRTIAGKCADECVALTASSIRARRRIAVSTQFRNRFRVGGHCVTRASGVALQCAARASFDVTTIP